MGYIYWIASYPKSGNTWMRAFLTSLSSKGGAVPLDDLQEIAPDDNHGSFFAPFMSKPLPAASLEDFARARPLAHRAMAEAAEGRLFLKTHSMVTRHLGTPTITPDVTAGAVYIIRNPLDVAVSYSAFRDRSIDATIELMAQRGRAPSRPSHGSYQLPGSWSENVESWTRKANPGLLVVRYEDMLDTPEQTFGKVASFLKMGASADEVGAAIASTRFSVLREAEAKTGFGERPPQAKAFFRSGRAGEWREQLSDEQVSRIVTTHGAQMRRFGYWLPEFDGLMSLRSDPFTGDADDHA